MFCKPGLLFDQFLIDLIWYPSIPFAQNAQEVRPAVLDLSQTDGEDFTLSLLFVSNAPMEINLTPSNPSFLTEFPEFWKDELYKFFAFLMHIKKGRRNEHTN